MIGMHIGRSSEGQALLPMLDKVDELYVGESLNGGQTNCACVGRGTVELIEKKH